LFSHELGSNAMKESYAEYVIMEPIQRGMQDSGNHDISKMKNTLKFITYRKKKPIFEVWIFTVALFTPVHTIVLIDDLKPEHNMQVAMQSSESGKQMPDIQYVIPSNIP